jgi:hypothetical protein
MYQGTSTLCFACSARSEFKLMPSKYPLNGAETKDIPSNIYDAYPVPHIMPHSD